MYRILKSDIPKLCARLAENMDVFAPVKAGGKTNFALWTEDSQVDLDTLKTVKSPKDVFFPQSEVLYNCNREEGKIKILPSSRLQL